MRGQNATAAAALAAATAPGLEEMLLRMAPHLVWCARGHDASDAGPLGTAQRQPLQEGLVFTVGPTARVLRRRGHGGGVSWMRATRRRRRLVVINL